jgi:hypothetical protein
MSWIAGGCSGVAAADALVGVLAAVAMEAEGRDSRENSNSPPDSSSLAKQVGSQRIPAAAEVRSQWKKWVRRMAFTCSMYSPHMSSWPNDLLPREVTFEMPVQCSLPPDSQVPGQCYQKVHA